MTAVVDSTAKNQTVAQLAGETNACWLRPQAFFVSWQGVLTMAYSGFPPPLKSFKERMSSVHPELSKENPGSKWPKTSLGALKDGKRLTPQDLTTLTALCRSLEQIIDCQNINFSRHLDECHPTQAEQDNVAAVLQEADDPSYWFSASRDGNRESHYRGTALGATLVVKFNNTTTASKAYLLQLIHAFKQAVDEAVPGLYAWFDEESLHVTIRALMG